MSQIKLSELNEKIKDSINISLQESYWIIAEVNQLSTGYNGHAYLELIEKNPKNNKITAKARATIWVSTFSMLKPYFEHTTGNPFKEGIKILINVTVTFHSVYGLSLNVLDIDPVYTLGDLEKQKLETINQLKSEGIFEMNKQIEIPLIPQKIAVISSKTAAGYGDFINQLQDNSEKYKFYYHLFPAVMQGDKSEESIIAALDKIYENETSFDVVVIIRGGGSKTDLSSFDNYDLALNICQFPLPIITGIGHQRDETIADLVANTSLKTPTAVASFLISKLSDFENVIINKQSYLYDLVSTKINDEIDSLNNSSNYFNKLTLNYLKDKNYELQTIKGKLNKIGNYYINDKIKSLNSKENKLKQLTSNIFLSQKNILELKKQKLKTSLSEYFLKQEHRLEIASNIVELKDPKNILKKGYSITTQNGKLLKNAEQAIKGELIETELFEGKIISEIKNI